MSKDLSEFIENLHTEVTGLRNEQTDFRISITKYVTSMSRDTEWMREKIDEMHTKFDSCSFCSDPDEIKSFKKSIKELRDEQEKVKYTAIGAASILSIIITAGLWIIQNKDNIITP